MVDDGMMERFAIDEVYGLHNLPGLEVGKFASRAGALMASTDFLVITIKGRGGHAAMPHQSVDPIVVAAHTVTALQSIVSRVKNPLESLVVSITKIEGGNAFNVIPEEVKLSGTIRSLDADLRKMAHQQIRQIAEGTAKAHSARAEVDIKLGYPVTFNHQHQTEIAGRIASTISGEDNVDLDASPTMGGEDFSYMLEARPGAFMFIGNGDTAGLHHPQYDFNDAVIPHGCSYWIKLVETQMNGEMA